MTVYPDGTKRLLAEFPNPYAPAGSSEAQSSHVVRIPREYSSSSHFDVSIPQFSTYYPGKEPGALSKTDLDEDGVVWGVSSECPLQGFLSEQEFTDVVNSVNECISRMYTVSPWMQLLYDVVGIFTLWLSDFVFRPDYAARNDLENLVATANEKYAARGIRFISPLVSGMLSFDIVITDGEVDLLQAMQSSPVGIEH